MDGFELTYINLYSNAHGFTFDDISREKRTSDIRVIIADDYEYMQCLSVAFKVKQDCTVNRHELVSNGMVLEQPLYELFQNYMPTVSSRILRGIASELPTEINYLTSGKYNEDAVFSLISNITAELSVYYLRALDGITGKKIYIEGKFNTYDIHTMYILSKLENSVIAIDNDYRADKYRLYNNFKIIDCTSMKGINAYMGDTVLKPIDNATLDSVIDMMLGRVNVEPNLIHIIGEDIACNLVEALGQLKQNTPNNVLLLEYGIAKPSYDEVNSVPRLQTSSVEQLIKRISWNMFAKKQEYSDSAAQFIKADIAEQDFTSVGKAMNRLVGFIVLYNRIDLTKQVVVCYGALDNLSSTFVKFLALSGKTVIVIDVSDNKGKGNGVDTTENIWTTIRLDTIVEDHPYPDRVIQGTIAYGASKEMDKVLYNGDTVGLYRTRQYQTCSIATLHTTFDEMRILWDKEVTVRQSFDSTANSVTVPVFYTKVVGWNDEYLKILSQLNTEHTIVAFRPGDINHDFVQNMKINHFADINNTSFKEQKPMYKNGMLDIATILAYRTFSYRRLDIGVQKHILMKVNQLITENWIYYQGMTEAEFVDLVLNTTLNLSERYQQELQWHDFTKQNPKLIVLCQDMEEITIEQSIIITLLHLCGWDVTIMVPTGYNVIGTNIRTDDMQQHIIGESKFNLGIQMIPAYEPDDEGKGKKKGFFSRLFG